MELLSRVLSRCSGRDVEIVESLGLDTLEGLESMLTACVEGIREGFETMACSEDDENVCGYLFKLTFPSDEFRQLAFCLVILGLSPGCAEALAGAYFAGLLPHGSEVYE